MSGEKPHEIYGRRSGRNWAVFGGLAGVVAILFAVTIAKLGDRAASPFAAQFNPQIEFMQERNAAAQRTPDAASDGSGGAAARDEIGAD